VPRAPLRHLRSRSLGFSLIPGNFGAASITIQKLQGFYIKMLFLFCYGFDVDGGPWAVVARALIDTLAEHSTFLIFLLIFPF